MRRWNPRSPWLVVVLLCAVIALVAAACSSDGDSADEGGFSSDTTFAASATTLTTVVADGGGDTDRFATGDYFCRRLSFRDSGLRRILSNTTDRLLLAGSPGWASTPQTGEPIDIFFAHSIVDSNSFICSSLMME